MKMEPAASIIEFLGGARKVAVITGKHYSRVYRWSYPEDRGGCGGFIPAREQRKLMQFCLDHKIDLRADDFFRSDRLQRLLETMEQA